MEPISRSMATQQLWRKARGNIVKIGSKQALVWVTTIVQGIIFPILHFRYDFCNYISQEIGYNPRNSVVK
jgi:hypothetical protein